MADKRLVVTDVDPNSNEFGAMLARAPGSATALPIPAFRYGAVQPAAGTVAGEGLLTPHGAASVGTAISGTRLCKVHCSVIQLMLM